MQACRPVITALNTETDHHIAFFLKSQAAHDFFHAGDRPGLLHLPLCLKIKTSSTWE